MCTTYSSFPIIIDQNVELFWLLNWNKCACIKGEYQFKQLHFTGLGRQMYNHSKLTKQLWQRRQKTDKNHSYGMQMNLHSMQIKNPKL